MNEPHAEKDANLREKCQKRGYHVVRQNFCRECGEEGSREWCERNAARHLFAQFPIVVANKGDDGQPELSFHEVVGYLTACTRVDGVNSHYLDGTPTKECAAIIARELAALDLPRCER